MNFKTITYVAAAVMAASCGNSSNKTAEQVATANEPRLVNVKVMTAETKDVPQSDVYSSIVEAYAKNNIAPQSPSRIQKIYVEVGDFVKAGETTIAGVRCQVVVCDNDWQYSEYAFDPQTGILFRHVTKNYNGDKQTTFLINKYIIDP